MRRTSARPQLQSSTTFATGQENSRREEYHRAMSSLAAAVPDDRSTLCEGCGYTLDGLPPNSNCPECGRPVAESTIADQRRAPAWETHPSVGNFVAVTLHVLLRP